VVNYLIERQRSLAERSETSVAAVVKELARLGMSDMRSYVSWGPDGLRLKDSKDLSVDEARAVAMVEETRKVIPVKDGDPITETTFRLHDKKSALDSIGKSIGLSARPRGQ
jgi:phage terminase small subunit